MVYETLYHKEEKEDDHIPNGRLSLYTALPPREDYVQVDCVLKPRYKKCTEKEKIKMIGLKRMYKKN